MRRDLQFCTAEERADFVLYYMKPNVQEVLGQGDLTLERMTQLPRVAIKEFQSFDSYAHSIVWMSGHDGYCGSGSSVVDFL